MHAPWARHWSWGQSLGSGEFRVASVALKERPLQKWCSRGIRRRAGWTGGFQRFWAHHLSWGWSLGGGGLETTVRVLNNSTVRQVGFWN